MFATHVKAVRDLRNNYPEVHMSYVREKLAEAEAIAGDPEEWTAGDELFKAWDSWEAVKK